MARQPPPLPYSKQLETPLPQPDISSAVNQVQLPENIRWQSGDRGFTKRYGSLPLLQMPIVKGDVSFASGPIMLASVRTPAWLLNKGTDGTRYLSSSMTLMFMYNQLYDAVDSTGTPASVGLYEITKTSVGTLPTTSPFFGRISRAEYSRTDPNYYITCLSGTTTLGDVTVPASWKTFTEVGSATGTGLSGTQAALTASLDPVDTNADVRDVSPFRTYSAYNVARPGGAALCAKFGTAAGNNGNMSALSTSTGVFIGGGGGSVFYYDGFDTWLAGAPNLSVDSAVSTGVAGAGVLTGNYRYFVTYRVRLESGEFVESEPCPTSATAIYAAQSGTISFTHGSASVGGYNYKTYATSTTGTVSTIVATTSVELNVGQTITFFLSGIRATRTVTSISGSSIGLSASINLSGTTYFSTGAGYTLYRTVAGGSVFYRLAEFAPNSGTGLGLITYTDNTSDAALTVEYTETATTRLPPPIMYSHAIAQHQNRLCVLSTSNVPTSPYVEPSTSQSSSAPTLWISSAVSQLYFDARNTVTFTYTGRDRPTGLISVNDLLYVFFNSKIYYIQGALSDATTFSVQLLDAKVGCTDPKSIVQVKDSIIFMSQHGLTELRGTTLNYDVGEEVKTILYDSAVKDVRCFFWTNENTLLVSANKQFVRKTTFGEPNFSPSFDDAIFSNTASPVQFFITTTPRTLAYSFEAKKWAVWDIDIYSGVTENADGELITIDRGTAVLMSFSDGSPYTLNIRRLNPLCNWTDTGVPFTARWYSEWFDGGVPAVDKSFNRAQVFSTNTESIGQGFKLTVSTERDWQPGLTVDKFTDITDFKVDTGYAEQPYDSQPYGDPELSQKVFALSNQRCKSMRLVVENSEPNRNICISGAAIEVQPKYANMKDE